MTMHQLIGAGYEGIMKTETREKGFSENAAYAQCVRASPSYVSSYLVRVNGVDRQYYIEELEELQTLPRGYTKAAGSNIKRAEVTGDGYTVVVIEDLLRGANLGSERVEAMEVEPVVGSGGSSAAATTEAMPPPAPQSPASAPAPTVAQSPVEQQLAQMMATQQQMQQQMQQMQIDLQAAQEREEAAKEELKVKRARDEVSSGSNRNYGGSQRTN
jgi:hypothetical protein